MIRRLAAVAILAGSYATALAASRACRRLRRTRARGVTRIALIGRFDNQGWVRAHLAPLRRIGLDAVVVIADEPVVTDPPVRFTSPPAAFRPFGRAAAKFFWLLVTAWRSRPDVYIGFHIFPGAISALIVARLFGRPAGYQMTGGEIEVIGGGAGAENSVMASLAPGSALVERLALLVVREFDLVVVRGSKAQRFLHERGIVDNVAINTASVVPATAAGARRYDLAFVGRMTAIKQPEQFVEIVARVARELPYVRAVAIGGGPLLSAMQSLVAARHLAAHLTLVGQRDDAAGFLADSRIFVLTSRSEGLPIAAAEAMAAGAVPVVADVGELPDLVTSGVSGYLIAPGDLDAYAARVVALLRDEPLRERMSLAAREAAIGHLGVDAVAARWRRDFARLASGTAATPVEGLVAG